MSESNEEYDDDIILADLSDEELVEQMHDDLYDGLKEEIEEGTNILLSRDWSAEKVLNEALVAGMTIVGVDFRDGILFVPEVLLAANAMKGDKERCVNAGMDDYLSKPFDAEDLIDKVEYWASTERNSELV